MNIVNENEEVKDDTFVNEVKLQKYAGDIYGLNRNGHAMRCPIIPATLIQVRQQGSAITPINGTEQQPQVVEQPKPCNSNCPLFLMRKKADGGYRITIGCGSSNSEHDATEIMPHITKKKD